MLNRRVKALAGKILPGFLLAWLDPVQKIIDSEVARAAGMLGEKQVVLDAGAGEARYRQVFTRGRYIALDRGIGDASWDYAGLDIRGDLAALPLRSESVDGILCMVVLEHTPNPGQVLREFARILKPRGTLRMVVPFLWEEHQAPHDYFRFTRYGIASLFEPLPFGIDQVRPMGGFFWLCARRSINLLAFFQGGWRWILFVPLAPFFGFLLPLLLYFLDGLDDRKEFTLGFLVQATKKGIE